MSTEINEAQAVLGFAENAYRQFDAGVHSSIKALAVSRSDGLIAQLAYFAAARKGARKLIADAKAKLTAAEEKHGN